MLHTISWTEYFLVMGVALVIYYGWWVVKYAGSLGWLKAKPRKTDGRLAALYVAAPEEMAGPEALASMVRTEEAGVSTEARTEKGVAEAGAAEMRPEEERPEEEAAGAGAAAEEPVAEEPAAEEPVAFLSMLAGELLVAVGALAERAAAGKIGEHGPGVEAVVAQEVPAGKTEEEVAGALGELLRAAPYCRLRETKFRESVTGRIVPVLEKLGFAGLDAKVVNGLWDG